MIRSVKWFLLLEWIIFSVSLLGQEKNDDCQFRSPLDFDLFLSGTFGELRTNHFHAGIDIKTGGVEGKKVYAIGDGYVSRIKVSTGGYGKALYITHPCGYVSVYGHLKSFNKTITELVRKEQYKNKTFEIEVFPDKGELPVKKGELIALSGNSGGSYGPHLHFEIRKKKNEHPVNPLFFKGMKIRDITRPRIKWLSIYPMNDSTAINDVNDTLVLEVNGWGMNHYLKGNPEIKVRGKIAFGLSSYDLMDRLSNKNGVYSQELYFDSALVFAIKMDELSFATMRYINSLIDYAYYKEKGVRLVETKLDTNNRLGLYDLVKNNGVFEVNDTLVHSVKYVVKDSYGNTGELRFKIKGYVPDTIIPGDRKVFPSSDTVLFLRFDKKYSLSYQGMKIVIPPYALYRSTLLSFGLDTGLYDTSFYSNVFRIGSESVPLQKRVTLSLDVKKKMPDSLTSKLFIAQLDRKGNAFFVGGGYKSNAMTVKTRDFGRYTVMMDTVKPVIVPLNVKDGQKVSDLKVIKFKIDDEYSGINRYEGYLNDRWVLMQYEPKKQLLFYEIDSLMKKGENRFKLTVSDHRDNRSVYKATFHY